MIAYADLADNYDFFTAGKKHELKIFFHSSTKIVYSSKKSIHSCKKKKNSLKFFRKFGLINFIY